jgi:hypothetical protein
MAKGKGKIVKRRPLGGGKAKVDKKTGHLKPGSK